MTPKSPTKELRKRAPPKGPKDWPSMVLQISKGRHDDADPAPDRQQSCSGNKMQKSPADDAKEPYRRRKSALQISPRWSFKLAKDAIMMQTLHKTGSKVGGGDEMGVTTHGE
mmetsp:Transcript_77000/g.112736  ORF Transcript_77000/g.112736 Transcript_77000/m.112736 type:complete len:112 (-) Transcript_77000:212-547(-)